MSEKVSVIVPVYNVETYLEKCVESVLCQTYADYELILVDDGSTDGSGTLCDSLAQRDTRIRVLHQENQGLSGARNAGLSATAGQWVIFLDSDDFWGSSDLLERLVSYTEENSCEVVCFNYRRVWDDGKTGAMEMPFSTPTTDVVALVRSNTYVSSACTKIISRALLERADIRFIPRVYSEDVLWSLKLLRDAERIGYVPDVWYGYLVRTGSITQSRPLKNVKDLFLAVQSCREESALCKDAERKNLCMDYTAFYYCMLLAYLPLVTPRPDRDFTREVYAMKPLLKHNGHRIVQLVSLCAKVTGVRITSQLLSHYVCFTAKRKRREA